MRTLKRHKDGVLEVASAELEHRRGQRTFARALEETSATLRELAMSLRPVRVIRRLQLHKLLGLPGRRGRYRASPPTDPNVRD